LNGLHRQCITSEMIKEGPLHSRPGPASHLPLAARHQRCQEPLESTAGGAWKSQRQNRRGLSSRRITLSRVQALANRSGSLHGENTRHKHTDRRRHCCCGPTCARAWKQHSRPQWCLQLPAMHLPPAQARAPAPVPLAPSTDAGAGAAQFSVQEGPFALARTSAFSSSAASVTRRFAIDFFCLWCMPGQLPR